MSNYAVTPDGRYLVVKGRLWRCSDPSLSEDERGRLDQELMNARRAVMQSKSCGDASELRVARELVNEVKVKLGERGAPWWKDGSADYNRKMVANTPYVDWYASLDDQC
ncbi:hypothetical protein [Pseudomonas guariconensis]|uniref:Uncharacterized protein n=1 Tax=Pseudomonas guariconensis TaxID=1288410 RepID=A0AAX0VU87_9PSED|nr:hypothetical protein [Pseudomonas guariconensis]PLV17838.1 hypothetical protein CXG49_17805 [Pseudomonas guariconensis]PLV22574.1 hypothetical protein CXG53_18650 [Pseudomonas guariconensis]PLV27597.1 hypothetical protein CXG51_19125 [Pseudomonas guariconensis]